MQEQTDSFDKKLDKRLQEQTDSFDKKLDKRLQEQTDKLLNQMDKKNREQTDEICTVIRDVMDLTDKLYVTKEEFEKHLSNPQAHR